MLLFSKLFVKKYDINLYMNEVFLSTGIHWLTKNAFCGQVNEEGKYSLVLIFEAKALELKDFIERQVYKTA